MAKRGRAAGFKMPEEHRTKIANSKVLNRLIDFASGEEGVEMSGPQVTAALGLLKKCLPDLQSIELSGDPDKPIKTEEVGAGSQKLAAFIDSITERSREAGEPSEE